MASVRELKMIRKREQNSQSAHALQSGVFMTQKTEKIGEVKREIEELQSLLQGATQTSQSTLLLRKRKEMREIDVSFDLMKKDYKKRMDECEERRLLFEVKQAKMGEQVLKFEKFIQENDAKRLRADAKAKHERQLYTEKCKELSSLKSKIEELDRSRDELVIELDVQRRYRLYLLQTIEVGEGYEEVPELLSRYCTLQQATEELLKVNSEQENETDEFRIKLQTLKTAMQNKSLVGNSVIHQYQTKLEETREFARTVETEKHHLEDKKKDVSRDYSQVAQAVKNLFTRCQATIRTKSMMAPPAASLTAMSHIAPALTIAEDLDSELDVIYYRLTDLIEISEEFRSDGECNTDDSTVGSRSMQGPQAVGRSTVR